MQGVAIYTLGCKLNFTESATLARQFESHGFIRKEFHEPADVYVINTCSVTDNADKKCRKVVQQALRQNPAAYVLVVGCYAQLKPEEIAGIPGVAAVLGAAEKFRLFELIQEFVAGKPAQQHRGELMQPLPYVPTYSMEERTRAFLKVQDGCNYKCSFCTIPLARGPSRSQPLNEVVATAQQLTAAGAQEIVLTGINLGDYHHQDDKLIDLLQALELAPGIAQRLRLSSIEPNLLSDAVVQLVASSCRFMPHFHIPLQSGSNKVLAAMQRRYRTELYQTRIATIRQLLPHAAIGVDVIVGFPGETDANFEETYQLLATLEVSYLHVFPYSERDNTVAARLPQTVPQPVREQRSQRLRELSVHKRQAFYARHIGQVRPVLFEQAAHGGAMQGFTDNYIRVSAPYDPLWVNEVLPMQLEEPVGDVLRCSQPAPIEAALAGY